MGTVHNLDDYREHVVLVDQVGNAHVVPLSLLEAVAKGETSLKDLGGWEVLVRVIIEEWIEFIRGDV